MKVLVFIEADLVVRHFVHSGVFADLAAKHDVTFIFPEPGYKRMGEVDVSRLDLRGADQAHLTVHQGRQTLWKPLFQIDQLRWRPGGHWRSIRELYRNNIGPKAAALYTVLSLPGIYPLVRALLYRKLAERPYHDLQSLLDELRPDVVIHPCVLEGVYINDLIEALPKRGIPFIAIMNSWDNPSTKRAMVGIPDWLLVWGDQTNKHAIEYAKMPPDRTVNFAAAQFDVFRRQPSISRDAFCRQHDIDPDSRIVLYAGSSKESDEFSHLCAIDEAIDAGRLTNVTVVYRPHPWGGGGKGGERFLDYPWRHIRLENGMRAYLKSVAAGSTEKFLSDYRKTHDLLCVVDALVSPLSTIVVEGAMHGKPVACFLPTEERSARHFQLTVSLVHFEDMYRMPEYLVAHGREQLIPTLGELLSRVGDEEFSRRLRESTRYFVAKFDRPYGERLTTFVEDVVGDDSACQVAKPERVPGRFLPSEPVREEHIGSPLAYLKGAVS